MSPGVEGITNDEPAITAPAPIDTIPSRIRWLLLRPESPAKLASSNRIRARVSDTRLGSGSSAAVDTGDEGAAELLAGAALVALLAGCGVGVPVAVVLGTVGALVALLAGCGVGPLVGAGCGALASAAVVGGALAAASLEALATPASLEFVGAYVVPSGRRGASHGEGTTLGVCAPANADHHDTTNPIHRANNRFTRSNVARAMPRVGRRYSLGQLVQLSCR